MTEQPSSKPPMTQIQDPSAREAIMRLADRHDYEVSQRLSRTITAARREVESVFALSPDAPTPPPPDADWRKRCEQLLDLIERAGRMNRDNDAWEPSSWIFYADKMAAASLIKETKVMLAPPPDAIPPQPKGETEDDWKNNCFIQRAEDMVRARVISPSRKYRFRPESGWQVFVGPCPQDGSGDGDFSTVQIAAHAIREFITIAPPDASPQPKGETEKSRPATENADEYLRTVPVSTCPPPTDDKPQVLKWGCKWTKMPSGGHYMLSLSGKYRLVCSCRPFGWKEVGTEIGGYIGMSESECIAALNACTTPPPEVSQ